MNLEMPSPAEADSLRTILLIVLGVMILTIPVVCVIVVAKVTAQRKQRPPLNRGNDRARHDTGGMDPMIMGSAVLSGFPEASQSDALPHHSPAPHHCHEGEAHHTPDHSAAGDGALPSSAGESSWSDSGSSFSDGGSSFSDGGSCGGGGDSGGGGSSSD